MDKYSDYTANDKQGFHKFEERSAEGEVIASFGSFEVFWQDAAGPDDREGAQNPDGVELGWYWRVCFPGGLPDVEPSGPFDTSQEAYNDAQEEA